MKTTEDPYTSRGSVTVHRLCNSVALLNRARKYRILLETYPTNIGQSTLLWGENQRPSVPEFRENYEALDSLITRESSIV
jgi:hypothetical protein